MAIPVLLVDGVGTGVVYQRQRDVLTIVLYQITFEKTAEVEDGMEVYRQIGCGTPTIRRNKKRSKDGKQ